MSTQEDPIQHLLERLSESWAKLPADEYGDETVLAYLRAAYGCGYVAGLEARQDLGGSS